MQAQWHVADATIMGTSVHVELWHPDVRTGKALVASVFDELRRIDRLMSPYKEASELSRINRDGGQHTVKVSAELVSLIRQSQRISELTHGAFDITFASVGFAYDYRSATRPDRGRLDALHSGIDYRNLITDATASTVSLGRPGVKIDLGGIAKGYAVERSIGLLQQHGIGHALVTAGGDTRVLGDRRGRPWLVGVRHPRARSKLITRLPLDNEAISTSGDYERFFEEDGVRYHHIINPRTGDSARQVQSVTVVGPDATQTDGLSTSVFVMGVERGLALIDSLNGYETIIVDRHGELHYSQGLEAR
mgnify:CR=1 FL=1